MTTSSTDAVYDVVVVGGATGNNVAAAAADAGLETTLVEKEPLGGTCLDRGCNPSKMLVQRANVAGTIHAHPTLSRVVEAAFRDVAGRVGP